MFIRTLPEDSKPVLVPEKPEIARKPKPSNGQLVNGESNGTASVAKNASFKRKRSIGEAELDEAQDLFKKRGKVYEAPTKDNDLVVVEDIGNGAILIDDD